ncbi:MAG TPA: hypothetical protein DDX16_07270, partial [Candidatus Omnitrophica bacterium]|nr:hypothetical protein [Candidatus Omnitrophota bacterium]
MEWAEQKELLRAIFRQGKAFKESFIKKDGRATLKTYWLPIKDKVFTMTCSLTGVIREISEQNIKHFSKYALSKFGNVKPQRSEIIRTKVEEEIR